MAAALVVPMAASRPAGAQTSGRNPAAAQALYDEARRLEKSGSYAEACPKFKASYELEPGGGTLLNLADCYEKAGKTSLAWTTFKEALVAAQRDGRSDRIEFANQRIASLESRLARLTVTIPGPSRAPGLSVTVDGSPLAEAAWGIAVPVDPGKHVVRAEAQGKKPFETSVDVPAAGAARESVEVPRLEDAPAGERPAPAGERPGPAAVSGSPPAEEARTLPDSRATVGWVVGAVGVASVGLGSYFGLDAFRGGVTATSSAHRAALRARNPRVTTPIRRRRFRTSLSARASLPLPSGPTSSCPAAVRRPLGRAKARPCA